MNNIDRKALTALLEFASEDNTRPHLCGVYWQPDNAHGVARAWATDGHTLVAYQGVPKAHVGDRFASVAKIKVALATARAAKIAEVDLDAISTRGEHTSPPVAAVVPERTDAKGTACGVASRFLARLEVIDKARDGRLSSWRLQTGPTPLDPIRCDGDAWIVVIMPVRL